MSDTQISCLRE